MVEQLVKEIKLENCCIWVSTPEAVHSIEVVVKHMVEMTGWLARNDIEGHRIKAG